MKNSGLSMLKNWDIYSSEYLKKIPLTKYESNNLINHLKLLITRKQNLNFLTEAQYYL